MKKNNKFPYESGLSVIKRDGEDIESMLRRLKKKILKDGLMQELKMRSSYEKPSDKKNRLKRESIRKVARQEKLDSKNRRED